MNQQGTVPAIDLKWTGTQADKSKKQRFMLELKNGIDHLDVYIHPSQICPPEMMKKPRGVNPIDEEKPNLLSGQLPIMTMEITSCTGQDVTYTKCSKCRDLTSKSVSSDSQISHSFALAGTSKVSFRNGKACLPVFFTCCPSHQVKTNKAKEDNFVNIRILIHIPQYGSLVSNASVVQWKKGKRPNPSTTIPSNLSDYDKDQLIYQLQAENRMLHDEISQRDGLLNQLFSWQSYGGNTSNNNNYGPNKKARTTEFNNNTSTMTQFPQPSTSIFGQPSQSSQTQQPSQPDSNTFQPLFQMQPQISQSFPSFFSAQSNQISINNSSQSNGLTPSFGSISLPPISTPPSSMSMSIPSSSHNSASSSPSSSLSSSPVSSALSAPPAPSSSNSSSNQGHVFQPPTPFSSFKFPSSGELPPWEVLLESLNSSCESLLQQQETLNNEMQNIGVKLEHFNSKLHSLSAELNVEGGDISIVGNTDQL